MTAEQDLTRVTYNLTRLRVKGVLGAASEFGIGLVTVACTERQKAWPQYAASLTDDGDSNYPAEQGPRERLEPL